MAEERDSRAADELAAIVLAARASLPASVVVRAAALASFDDSLDPAAALPPAEERRVARAGPKRRRDFAAGRACARAALARLGVEAAAIPAGPAGEPLWPAGIVGSITHHAAHAVAAVQRSDAALGLGIDLADAAPLDADLVARICTPEDRRALLAPAGAWPFDPHRAIFCIKEAVYKCVFPLVGNVFGFHDVHALLDPRRRDATIRFASGGALAGLDLRVECRFAATRRHVFAGAWIALATGHAQLPRLREHVSR